jgi:hypothetical protein
MTLSVQYHQGFQIVPQDQEHLNQILIRVHGRDQ